MKQQVIHISDAIPTPPASFDRAVETALLSVCTDRSRTAGSAKQKNVRAWMQRMNKRTGSSLRTAQRIGLVSVAAMLLLCTIAVGTAVGIRSRSGEPMTSDLPTEQASAPESQAYRYEIRLLPELEDAEVFAEARRNHGEPAFSEADWGWLRKIETAVENILIDGSTVAWTTVFRIPKDAKADMTENPFAIDRADEGMEVFADTASMLQNDLERTLRAEHTAGNPYRFEATDDAWIIRLETTFRRPAKMQAGTFAIDQTFRMIDHKVDSQANIATVGVIKQSFRMTAESIPPYVAPPQEPNALPYAFRYNGVLYRISEDAKEFAGEVDESAIIGTIQSAVLSSRWPVKDGQINFDGLGAPYAMTENGLVILIEEEWRLFEPVPEEESVSPLAVAPVVFISNGQTVEPYVMLTELPENDVMGAVHQMQLMKETDELNALPTVVYAEDFAIESTGEATVVRIDVFDADAARFAHNIDPTYLKTLPDGVYYLWVHVTDSVNDETAVYDCACRLIVGGADGATIGG